MLPVSVFPAVKRKERKLKTITRRTKAGNDASREMIKKGRKKNCDKIRKISYGKMKKGKG